MGESELWVRRYCEHGETGTHLIDSQGFYPSIERICPGGSEERLDRGRVVTLRGVSTRVWDGFVVEVEQYEATVQDVLDALLAVPPKEKT